MATPCYDPETQYLYTLSCDGDLYCWNTQKHGAPVWHSNLYEHFSISKSRPEYYGFVASPLLTDAWVIIEAGAKEGNLLAFNKRTGVFTWASKNTDQSGIASPTLVTVDGIPCVVALTRTTCLVARLDNGHYGDTLLEYPWPSQYAECIPTPLVQGQRLFLTMCESSGHRTALLELTTKEPSGFRVRYVTDSFFTCTSTAALSHDDLYFRTGKSVKCVHLADGKERWTSPAIFAENHAMGAEVGNLLVTGDDKLLIWDGMRGGSLVLAEASPDGPYHELARLDGVTAAGPCYPHLALADEKMLCRMTDGALVCLTFTLPQRR